MKIHLRFDDSNAEHTRATLFLNGANCGTLCAKTKEMLAMYQILSNVTEIDTFVSSGHFWEGDCA